MFKLVWIIQKQIKVYCLDVGKSKTVPVDA